MKFKRLLFEFADSSLHSLNSHVPVCVPNGFGCQPRLFFFPIAVIICPLSWIPDLCSSDLVIAGTETLIRSNF